MKRSIKFIFISLLTIGIAGSCVDLEENPEALLSPSSFFNATSDYEAFIIGTYRPLYGNYAGYDFLAGFTINGGSDDLSTFRGDGTGFDNFSLTADNGQLTSIWTMFYQVVNNANTLLASIENTDVLSPVLKNDYEGQAKFLRAFGYFHLTRYWGEVALITESNLEIAGEVAQSPVEDIYAQIVSDLKDAETMLPVSFPEKGKVTRGAAKALLAEVYLTMAGWPLEQPSNYALARDKANELISGEMAGTYSLENDFADLWLADNKLTNSEFIFAQFGISTAGWIPGNHLHLTTRPGAGGEGGWADYYSEERFLNAFPDSYRKDVSFHTVFADGSSYQDSPPNEPFIGKFRDAGAACGTDDPSCAADGDGSWVFLRYAQVLLTYAEAANKAENGSSPDALLAINMVRRRANMLDPNTPNASVDLPSGMSESDFNDAVINERAWELSFEGHRWFDMVRNKIVVEVNQGLYPNVSANNRWLPKPASQVSIIEGLNQNPGY